MSKRSGSSIPLMAEKSGLRRKTDSPVSKSGSSSDPHNESGHHLLAPTPLSYASPISPSVGPASSVGEDDLNEWRKDYSLSSAVALRIPGEIRFHDSSGISFPVGLILPALEVKATSSELERFLMNGVRWHGRRRPEDPMTAFKRAADAILAKRGAIDMIASDDEVMITGRRRRVVVKAGATSSSQERKSRGGVTTRPAQQSSGAERTYDGFSGVLADLNAKVFPQDQTLLPDEDPSEVIRMIQGRLLRTLFQLHHLGDRLLEGNPSSDREEKEVLSRQLSEEKSKRVAKELELRDLQAKVKAIEGSVEISLAEALKLSREKQELGEALVKLKAEVEASEDMRVMAVNGTKIATRWEVMREWLYGQARKWDLAKEFDQFKTVVLAEANFKVVDPPSFKDKPVIPPFLDMDVDPHT
ncbi:hypothetical protein Bca52824_016647 [Brassica carinata]|uniref:Uncharacterized protein n=1 Tax=Brassica carinata TaxID=52824 RepID=A0A8X7W5I6_BRACI|nr:hypothetical protein Bca52824_016647 [Brassica carinata]